MSTFRGLVAAWVIAAIWFFLLFTSAQAMLEFTTGYGPDARWWHRPLFAVSALTIGFPALFGGVSAAIWTFCRISGVPLADDHSSIPVRTEGTKP